MLHHRADFVMIDPFGTPCMYLDSVFRSCPKGAVAVITATDAATLYGVAPQAALRHYGGASCRKGSCTFLVPHCTLIPIITVGYVQCFIIRLVFVCWSQPRCARRRTRACALYAISTELCAAVRYTAVRG